MNQFSILKWEFFAHLSYHITRELSDCLKVVHFYAPNAIHHIWQNHAYSFQETKRRSFLLLNTFFLFSSGIFHFNFFCQVMLIFDIFFIEFLGGLKILSGISFQKNVITFFIFGVPFSRLGKEIKKLFYRQLSVLKLKPDVVT